MSDLDKNLVFWSPFVAASLVAAVLKLAGVLTCSWWMVVLPILMPLWILLMLLLVFLVFVVMVGTFPRRKR